MSIGQIIEEIIDDIEAVVIIGTARPESFNGPALRSRFHRRHMNKGRSECPARAWVYGPRMLAAQALDPVIAWEGK